MLRVFSSWTTLSLAVIREPIQIKIGFIWSIHCLSLGNYIHWTVSSNNRFVCSWYDVWNQSYSKMRPDCLLLLDQRIKFGINWGTSFVEWNLLWCAAVFDARTRRGEGPAGSGGVDAAAPQSGRSAAAGPRDGRAGTLLLVQRLRRRLQPPVDLAQLVNDNSKKGKPKKKTKPFICPGGYDAAANSCLTPWQ